MGVRGRGEGAGRGQGRMGYGWEGKRYGESEATKLNTQPLPFTHPSVRPSVRPSRHRGSLSQPKPCPSSTSSPSSTSHPHLTSLLRLPALVRPACPSFKQIQPSLLFRMHVVGWLACFVSWLSLVPSFPSLRFASLSVQFGSVVACFLCLFVCWFCLLQRTCVCVYVWMCGCTMRREIRR
ncbi:hypothetical protein HDK90DRAFT_49265 [Phyllosticta capitalensis]|uniref:Uncharacterized protein n=1 Tax=Phyllosticta capitalensis TaxID=121624 RepID=A0ABR1YDV6_9PEZI